MTSYLFQSGGFLMPLIICSVISTAILWFYRTKNPVKRFRPHFGELAVLGVVLYGISVGVSFFVYRTIETGADSITAIKEAKEAQDKGQGPGKSGEAGDAGGGGSVFEETLTNMDEQRREAAERERRGE